MKKKIRWTRLALNDLTQIRSYIARDNGSAARKVTAKIMADILSLTENPARGRNGRVKGTRELILADLPYIVVYGLRGDYVEILTVFHTSRCWPD